MLLYTSLVRSCLSYCSPLWRLYLIQDIILLEKVHQLQLLPSMYVHVYELSDILFFIKSVRSPSNSFYILNYVSFVRGATRSSNTKLFHRAANNRITSNSYFYRIPKLWNALPEINLTLSLNTIKKKLNTFLWNHFIQNFDPSNNCVLHFVCPCYNCNHHPSTLDFGTL